MQIKNHKICYRKLLLSIFTFILISSNTIVYCQTDTVILSDLIPAKGILYEFDSNKAVLLDEFINTYQEYFKIPGVSLALIKNGQIIYHKTYGIKNTITKEPVDAKTLFEAGSVTKPVFAFVVMRLVDKGIIDLDKPLYQYLPYEDIAHDERYKLITARHVLCHQTGFPNWPDRKENGQFDLKFTPGTDFGYSGEGFEYLKRVVEYITEKDINVIFEEEFIIPLSIKNTYFKKNDTLSKFAANGHFNNVPKKIRLIDNPKVAYGMYTDAKSFAEFIIALNNRTGLKPENYNEMFKVQTIISRSVTSKKISWGNYLYWGLGFKLEKSPYGFVYGHDGSTSTGFVCSFNMFQDLNMGYVIFTNSDSGGDLALSPMMEFLITGKE